MNIVWVIVKILFSRKKLKAILRLKSKDEILEFKTKALLEENYELAAYLEYYINFKFDKEHQLNKS
ncbi:MAG: hypothetical protein E6R13_06210 [Spirochaetes bacterium]|nr:MAG: hypothetical protein E6R13_06210 [Spirochaetota bacterium]